MIIKVLLVDDEKDFLEPFAQRLEARGLSVRTALSGEEALEKLEGEDTDVIVLDLFMPGLNGLETLQRIKHMRPLVEVILLTGHGDVGSAITGMNLGAFYYLMKPAEMGVVVKEIAMAYRRKSEQEERIRRAEIERLMRSAEG